MKKKFFLTVVVMVLALVLGMSFSSTPVKATAIIDFNIVAPTAGGSIYYTGGITPLYGVNIEVDSYAGIGTPLNNGVTVPITGYYLNFTTGNVGGTDSSHWYFGPGGSITISDGITTLLSGTFTSVQVDAVGSTYKVEIAGFFDTKDPNLLAYFGLPDTTYSGNFNISFYASGLPPGSFTSRDILSGDLTNTLIPVIPEPATMLLLGSGLVGIGAFVRRRFKK